MGCASRYWCQRVFSGVYLVSYCPFEMGNPHIEIKILSTTLKIQKSLNFYANTKWKL